MQSFRPRDKPCIEVVDDPIVEILRTKTPAEKITMIAAAHRTARLLAAAGVRYQYPNWSEDRVHAEVLRRITGGTR